ncbi:MAG: hypothetical protein MNPFHGCM_01460 [Gemmatimonadaceae bacterium]|nr:hypothetical protein [Gemmatimonadaceae bacterium]
MVASSDRNGSLAGGHPGDMSRRIRAACVGLLVVQNVVAAILLAVPFVSSRTRVDFDNAAMAIVGLATTLAAATLVRHPGLDRETRRAWRWLTVAFLFQWTGNAYWWWLETVRHQSPLVSWSDALYLLFFPFFLLGVLRYPHPRHTWTDSTRYWLEVSMVLVSGGTTMWYLTQFGDALRVERSPFALVYALGYPFGDVLTLVALAVLTIRSTRDGGHRPIRYLAAGMALMLVGDIVHATLLKLGSYQSGSALDLVWDISATCLALAIWFEGEDGARGQRRLTRAAQEPTPNYLAYASSALLFLVLVRVGYAAGSTPLLVLTVSAGTITALMIVHQLIAVRENVRLSTEAKAREGEARFRALVQHSSDVILIIDADSTIRFASPAAFDILGRRDSDLAGRRLIDLVHQEDTVHALRLIQHVIAGAHEAPREECRMLHGDGRWIVMEHVATNLLADAVVRGIVLNSRDVSEREELQRRLTHQAFHDPLTNLANRTLFLDRTDHAMKRSARDLRQVALLFIDLDDFKKVNDSLGHAAGDAMLVAVSGRLRSTLRDGDTLARLGGDEFGLLLEDCGGMARAMEVADRVRRVFREPLVLQGRDIFARASVGIASASDAASPVELLRNADLAMYVAKARGKGGSAWYEPRMHADIVLRLELEADLRQAIDRGELSLVFQPIVMLDGLEVRGVEALLRWRHPRYGDISPSQFVPIAEEAGLIAGIGRWVLREAARQARAWFEVTGVRIDVGVNISGRHIQAGRLVDDVQEALADAGIAPSQLLIEITESMLMRHGDEALDVLRGLRETGVSLALDDFGTGYSSLSYLQRFPIDVLKIDKAFIEGITAEGADPRLVRAIIALGESLNLRTVAEGVETEEQWRALTGLGCTMGQGYLFARPLPASEIPKLVRDGLPAPAVAA